jgi:hypothetical protein
MSNGSQLLYLLSDSNCSASWHDGQLLWIFLLLLLKKSLFFWGPKFGLYLSFLWNCTGVHYEWFSRRQLFLWFKQQCLKQSDGKYSSSYCISIIFLGWFIDVSAMFLEFFSDLYWKFHWNFWRKIWKTRLRDELELYLFKKLKIETSLHLSIQM